MCGWKEWRSILDGWWFWCHVGIEVVCVFMFALVCYPLFGCFWFQKMVLLCCEICVCLNVMLMQ